MSRKTASESPAAAAARRQPLLTTTLTSSESTNRPVDSKSDGGSSRRSKMGETTGDCAAVCCCCPCAMVHLIILAVYRFPRGLWRKKKRRRLLRKKRKMSSEEKTNHKPNAVVGFFGGDAEWDWESTEEEEDCGGKNDVVDWDNEMWSRFYGAGFWRSESQRKDDDD
ncbi:hypothetical protein ACS0TY_020086 [Phlomoides rotata]